jgi:hypothetical protein
LEVSYDASKKDIKNILIDKKNIDILQTKIQYKNSEGKIANKYMALFDLCLNGQEITAENRKLGQIINNIKNNARKLELKGVVFKRSTSKELNQLKDQTIDRLKKYLDFNGETSEFVKILQKEINAISKDLDPEIIVKDSGNIFDFIKRKSESARKGALSKGKRALKDNLFDTILNHYIEKELLYKDYVRYLEETGKISRETIDNYAPLWETAESELIQRLLWGIAFDFRNPITSERMNWREWMSYPLHHWMTGLGHENKFVGLAIGVVPITKEGDDGHMEISMGIEHRNRGEYYENIFRENIISVLNNDVPNNWKKETPEQIRNQNNFQNYLKSNVDTINMIKWFILTSHMDLLNDIDMTGLSTNQMLELLINRFKSTQFQHLI